MYLAPPQGVTSSEICENVWKSTVQDRIRHRWAAVSIHPHYGFVCGKHDAAWQPRSRNPQDWAVWRSQLGRRNVWCFLTQQFNCCTCAAQCDGALSCWNTKSLLDTAYRWQQYDVIMTSWSSIEEVSKRYHQNFLLCKNNEITACIADLFNSFLWRGVCGCIFQGSAATNYR